MSRRDKAKVLVVSPPLLSRVIRQLFDARRDFEVVGSLEGLKGLAPRVERMCPKVIVASVSPLRSNIHRTIGAIKDASPLSKLILICPFGYFAGDARRGGADACLEPDKLLFQLLPTAEALSTRSRQDRKLGKRR